MAGGLPVGFAPTPARALSRPARASRNERRHGMYLSRKASRRRLQEAENARANRLEIVAALSQGKITRRDLMRWGLLTAGGAMVLKNGLSPFARSAYADGGNIPTGTPPSPVPQGLQFTQPLPRLEVLSPIAVTALRPAPTEQANT